MEKYQKAIELDPAYSDVYFSLANLYLTEGKCKEFTEERAKALCKMTWNP